MNTYQFTRCESCGDVFTTATMYYTDTSPECGDCYNERHATEIRLRWIPAAESSEPDAHDDTEMTSDGLVCTVCNAVIADMATLRDDYLLEQAEIARDYELYG
jgi:predicted  nucleic acid-binding Zn-ribbon protein